MGILDIISTELNATDKSVNLYSTLDRVVGENRSLCEQSNGYNCGMFTIMTMILRYHGKQGFVQEKYTEEDLKSIGLGCSIS